MKLAVVLFLTLMLAGQAQAASISSLSDKPEEFGVWNGREFVPHVLEPNRTWRVPGQVRVSFRGQQNFISAFEEYTIWADGTFGPQRLMLRQNGMAVR